MNLNDFTGEYLSVNKIYNHLDRVKELLDSGYTLPIMMEIDMTNDCPHKCPKCRFSGNRFKKASLSFDFVKKVLNQTSSFLKSVVFTGGGEPLCNPDTIKVIKYAASKGLSVGLITNGSLLTPETAEIIVADCEWIRISIDGFTAEEYRQTHGVNEKYLENVWKNVKYLVAAKKNKRAGCSVGAAYLVDRRNKQDMMKFAIKAKKLGVNYCQFRPFHYSNFVFSESLSKTKILETADFKVIASMQRIIKEEGKFDLCLADNFRTVLAADGHLYPCCFTRGRKEFSLGNLKKNDFLTVWKSKRKKDIFKNKLSFSNAPFLSLCKLDYLNKLLWTMWEAKKLKHKNFI